jgi:hypothetical protein
MRDRYCLFRENQNGFPALRNLCPGVQFPFRMTVVMLIHFIKEFIQFIVVIKRFALLEFIIKQYFNSINLFKHFIKAIINFINFKLTNFINSIQSTSNSTAIMATLINFPTSITPIILINPTEPITPTKPIMPINPASPNPFRPFPTNSSHSTTHS